jgi:hypothetical protein
MENRYLNSHGESEPELLQEKGKQSSAQPSKVHCVATSHLPLLTLLTSRTSSSVSVWRDPKALTILPKKRKNTAQGGAE